MGRFVKAWVRLLGTLSFCEAVVGRPPRRGEYLRDWTPALRCCLFSGFGDSFGNCDRREPFRNSLIIPGCSSRVSLLKRGLPRLLVLYPEASAFRTKNLLY